MKKFTKAEQQLAEKTKPHRATVLSLFLLAVATGSVFFNLESALGAGQRDGDSEYIAPYVPTPQGVVDRMLELAEVGKGDLLYDLGSGDGRIVITAARRYGVKAVGFEIDPNLVKRSRDNIREAGVEHLVEIREQDVRTVDFSPASVLTMYLYPAANLRLRPAILRQLKPGSRVVSHEFGMGSWKPERTEQLMDSAEHLRTIYLWRIGAK
ncbi:MAG: class I SAM-dependent methyltransferase [Candidatus Binatia bacterium]